MTRPSIFDPGLDPGIDHADIRGGILALGGIAAIAAGAALARGSANADTRIARASSPALQQLRAALRAAPILARGSADRTTAKTANPTVPAGTRRSTADGPAPSPTRS